VQQEELAVATGSNIDLNSRGARLNRPPQGRHRAFRPLGAGATMSHNLTNLVGCIGWVGANRLCVKCT
jgi:hypothetical protein